MYKAFLGLLLIVTGLFCGSNYYNEIYGPPSPLAYPVFFFGVLLVVWTALEKWRK